jgi:hypothetical protein
LSVCLFFCCFSFPWCKYLLIPGAEGTPSASLRWVQFF